jgi:hypothetical protein
MSTSDDRQRQARAAIGKLDRNIAAAREKRLSGAGAPRTSMDTIIGGHANGTSNGTVHPLDTIVGTPIAKAAAKPVVGQDRYEGLQAFARENCEPGHVTEILEAGRIDGDTPPTPAQYMAATRAMVETIGSLRSDLAGKAAHFVRADSARAV